MNINPLEMMKNLQGMQSRMKEFKEKLGSLREEGTSGGDMVRVTVDGEFRLVDIVLSPEIVDPSDIVMLQDLIKAAALNAQSRMKERIQSEMKDLTGGLPLDQLNGMMGM